MVEKLPTETVETLAPTEPEKEPVKVHGCTALGRDLLGAFEDLGCLSGRFFCCCGIFEACCFVRDSILWLISLSLQGLYDGFSAML